MTLRSDMADHALKSCVTEDCRNLTDTRGRCLACRRNASRRNEPEPDPKGTPMSDKLNQAELDYLEARGYADAAADLSAFRSAAADLGADGEAPAPEPPPAASAEDAATAHGRELLDAIRAAGIKVGE